MTALWDSFSSLDGRALYVWAAVLGVLVFIVVELVLLELRRRSIMQHLGQSRHESLNPDEIRIQTTAADRRR